MGHTKQQPWPAVHRVNDASREFTLKGNARQSKDHWVGRRPIGDAAGCWKPKPECFRGIELGVTWYWEERW